MSCGDQPDAPGEESAPTLMPRKRPLRRVDKSICQRCRNGKSLYIMRSNTQCRDCYLLSINTNFLKILYPPLRPEGASKSIKQAIQTRPPTQTGNLLVPISGGCGSMAMLDMLLSGGYIGRGDKYRADKTKGEKDVVWDKAYVLFVDFRAVTGMKNRTEEVKSYIEGSGRGLEFVALRAEDVFDEALFQRLGAKHSANGRVAVDLSDATLPIASSSSSKPPLEQLRSFFNALPGPSRPSALSSILSHLIDLAASSLPNVSHVVLGETSTREAQRVISGTAMGRGWALPSELSASRNKGDDKSWIQMKPMKEITVKDAAIYCHLRGLTTVNHRQWGGAAVKGKAITIEGLTEQFIAGLTVTHPSTVSTINKTGDKLMFTGNIKGKRCPFCDEPVDNSALEWKSQTALTTLPNKATPERDVTVDSEDDSSRNLARQLCYACLTTFTPTSTRRQTGESTAMPLWMGDYLLSN